MKNVIIVLLFALPLLGCQEQENMVPSVPELLNPSNETVFNNFPRTTTLVWKNSSGSGQIEYLVEIQFSYDTSKSGFGKWGDGEYGAFPGITVDENIYNFTFVGAQSGRWRVKAINDFGESQWSSWSYFRYMV